MKKKCAIIPLVRNQEGLLVDSRLYQDLLSFTNNNRLITNLIYLRVLNTDFLNDYRAVLLLDNNGEPTFASLRKAIDIRGFISILDEISGINRLMNNLEKDGSIKYSPNRNQVMLKAINFNLSSPLSDEYVAIPVKRVNDTSTQWGIQVELKNKVNLLINLLVQYNESLNNKLRGILELAGIKVGALDVLETRLGINGVTDFQQAHLAAHGLVELIRIAADARGEQVLPEEFAHFVIEAMEDHPLVKRVLTNIANNNLAEDLLGDEYNMYEAVYDGDLNRLAKEAAGKLLASSLLLLHEIKLSPIANLFRRMVNAIKEFFSTNLSASDIKKAIKSSRGDFNSFASLILDGRLDELISLNNISSSDRYYNLSERINRDKALLTKIKDNELKRLNIFERRLGKTDTPFSLRLLTLISLLERNLNNNSEIEGIYNFLKSAIDSLELVDKRLMDILNTPASDTNEKARVLRDIRNYMYSYGNMAKEIRAAVREDRNLADNRFTPDVVASLDRVVNLIDELYADYKRVAMPLFVDFLKPIMGESITIPFGKFKGKTMTTELILKLAELDISFFDRWLDSMADSSDTVLRVIDQTVKKAKENARLRTIDIAKLLQLAGLRLEEAGVKDFEWMFERDDNGNLTGNYILALNYGKYRADVNDMFARLKEKYGANPVGEDLVKYKSEMKEFFDSHKEKIGDKVLPKASLYRNLEYENLNSALKEFYNTILDLKELLDKLLPDRYTTKHNAILIRKDLLERVKSSESIGLGLAQIGENIKELFIKRVDDTDFGDKATIQDFEGNEVQSLPVYFTRKLENRNDLSTDVVGTMIAYAAMANDFDEMNKIIDVLELGRDLLREREIVQTRGDKLLTERVNTLGRKVENKLIKKKDSSYFISRLNDFFEMQVYNRYMADEGTFGNTKIDNAKLANWVNRMTSLNSMALNLLLGISNVATGKVMMRIESFAGEFFNEKNTIIADRNYGLALPEYLAEVGNRVKTSKLHLWNELFDVLLEYEKDVREVNFDRKTWFSRMFGTSALFFMTNAGEHWMQTRTSLALADNYKMKDPSGNIVTLWDAMEVVPLDPSKPDHGAKLLVKEGYTKEDGSLFTLEDVRAFSRKAVALNLRMHGIYNKIDRNALLRLALGRMAMMFRKWAVPSLNRRLAKPAYNYDLAGWTEGYYRTAGRFMLSLYRDIKTTLFDLAARWNELTDTEKANIKRAITDMGQFIAVCAVLGLIDWSDDRDRPWLIKMTEYQFRRLRNEIGVLTPTPAMIDEGLKILLSPAAGIDYLEKLATLVDYMYAPSWFDEIESGYYEGHTRLYKNVIDVLPLHKTVHKGLNPEVSIPFFKL